MQHPIQLVPNPQRVPRCRQPGQEDTRTAPEPLQTHRNTSPMIQPRPMISTNNVILCIVEMMCEFHADCKKC